MTRRACSRRKGLHNSQGSRKISVGFAIALGFLTAGALRLGAKETPNKPQVSRSRADLKRSTKLPPRSSLQKPEKDGRLAPKSGGEEKARLFAPSGDGGGAGPNPCVVCLRGPIDCGGMVAGALAATDCVLNDGSFFDVYSLDLPGGAAVDIRLNAGFDTFLFLVDAGCGVLATNDDCPGAGLNSCLLGINLPPGGYFLVANSFAGGVTGDYTLSVECGKAFIVCEDCPLADIACGDTVMGDLADTDCTLPSDGSFLDMYRLELAAPTQLTVSMTAGFDTFLFLFDGACAVAAADDDSGEGLNSLISDVFGPGTFFIGANSFAPGDTGPYTLSVMCSEPVIVCEDCPLADIACGEMVMGDLAATDCTLPADGSFLDLYRLELAAPTQLTISMTAGFDTFLFLFDGACAVAAADDNSGEGLNSLISGAFGPGTFFIGANSFAPGATGPYTLSVTCGEPVIICEDCPVTNIACGNTVMGDLAATDCVLPQDGSFIDLYRLVLSSDAEVTLSMNAGFDTFLFVFDSACQVVTANDDCPGQGLNSCITAQLPAGTYFLGANSFLPGATGPYTLQVTCPSTTCVDCLVGNIGCDESVGGTLEAGGCQKGGGQSLELWQLDLAAMETVRIRLESAAVDPVLILYDSACQEIARNDDCGGAELNSCLELDLAPGTYFAGASSRFAGEAGDYSLMLRCGTGEMRRPVDCNADANVDISDGVCIFGFLFLGLNLLPCGDGMVNAANRLLIDWTGDGRVDISDGIALLLFLFNAGTPHVQGGSCIEVDDCTPLCAG
jgi:hypothetical protein